MKIQFKNQNQINIMLKLIFITFLAVSLENFRRKSFHFSTKKPTNLAGFHFLYSRIYSTINLVD